jgi:hypothetical protein
MRFVIVEITVVTAHYLIAFATGIFELDFLTAATQISKLPYVIVSIHRHYLSPPQPVPRKITAGAENTRAIG